MNVSRIQSSQGGSDQDSGRKKNSRESNKGHVFFSKLHIVFTPACSFNHNHLRHDQSWCRVKGHRLPCRISLTLEIRSLLVTPEPHISERPWQYPRHKPSEGDLGTSGRIQPDRISLCLMANQQSASVVAQSVGFRCSHMMQHLFLKK